jgi:RNA polymerase sigma-70 factor (ECF subfamily)
MELVAEVRPELHRYCARMTGSIADGEDVVQDTLAKAFFALATFEELPSLRPWLFRVAHNAAIDFTRRHENARVDASRDLPEIAESDERVDPDTVRAALATFLELPPLQRSAVILKDVVGHSNAEIADTLQTTVPAVKSALVRGRERLRREGDSPARETIFNAPAVLEQYVRLFSAGDWDGVRAMLAEEVRLDLVSAASKRGKAVGIYFTNYAKQSDLRVELGALDGRSVIWVFTPKDGASPKYFISIELDEHDRVALIRDYRYVPYVTREIALAKKN